MTRARKQETLTFKHPFSLKDDVGAGQYEVVDEELIEELSFPVYRRVFLYSFRPTALRRSKWSM